MKVLQLGLCIVLSFVSFLSCSEGENTTQDKENKITIQLDGAATPYYSPLFVAEEKGYFEEEGLSVEFYYAAASDIIKNVAANNVEFGFPNADAVILAKSRGIPIKVVHNTYQNGLGATIFKSSSGIKSAFDLKGKKIAVTSLGSPNYIQLQVLLKNAGLSLDDVTVEVVGTGAILTALVTDEVDAIVFSMLRTIELNNQGVDVLEIRSDTVLPSFGNVLIASDEYIESNSETVDAFSRALTKAINYISDGNALEAVDISTEKHVTTFDQTKRDITAQIIDEVFVPYLWQSDYTMANGIGSADVTRWEILINTSKDYDIIDNTFEVSDLLYFKIVK